MIKIIKFKGTNTKKHVINRYIGTVLVTKDDEPVKVIHVPVYAQSEAKVASLVRKWRDIPENMAKLEYAYDNDLAIVEV